MVLVAAVVSFVVVVSLLLMTANELPFPLEWFN